MKSTEKQLGGRGYLSEDKFNEFTKSDYSLDELLKSRRPLERTFAIRTIRKCKNETYIADLAEMLKKEKALYTKIELCECLAEFGTISIPFLIPYLGQIGNNQHKEMAIVDIGKKSYPLPRDIIARTIIRIGSPALTYLKNVLLTTEDRTVMSEAIDAIGHITFTTCDYSLEAELIQLYLRKQNDDLIKWKLIRCFQSFDSVAITRMLNDIVESPTIDDILRKEAARSMLRITTRKEARRKSNVLRENTSIKKVICDSVKLI